MGYRPLVALCLPLPDLCDFCLTKGFPKTPSATQPIGMPSVKQTNWADKLGYFWPNCPHPLHLHLQSAMGRD